MLRPATGGRGEGAGGAKGQAGPGQVCFFQDLFYFFPLQYSYTSQVTMNQLHLVWLASAPAQCQHPSVARSCDVWFGLTVLVVSMTCRTKNK